jgi:hypothetical protein
VDVVTLLIVVLILVFVFGGMSYPRATEGAAPINMALYILAVILVVVLVVRVLGVLV